MCCHDTDEYEYHIKDDDVDFSILKTPKDLQNLSRQERFKVYGELYCLFLYVSQEVHDFIKYEDIRDKRIEELIDQLPCVDYSHRELEEHLKNYTATEDDRLKEALLEVGSQISWLSSSIQGTQRDIQSYKGHLSSFETRFKTDTEKLDTLKKKRKEIEDTIRANKIDKLFPGLEKKPWKLVNLDQTYLENKGLDMTVKQDQEKLLDLVTEGANIAPTEGLEKIVRIFGMDLSLIILK
jgi:hypothetical protein